MIAIYGASVTKQKEGYAKRLKKDLGEKVKIFAYGGMHLNDAAICFVQDVTKYHPEYCFIDWFSTGYTRTDNATIEYIDTLIYAFSEIGCKIIFLFLPRNNIEERKDYYTFCKAILNEREVHFIDINQELSPEDELTNILRDAVHTTYYGSNLYSEIIISKFDEIKSDLQILQNISPTKYNNIKKLKVSRTFNNYILLRGNCEILGFYVTVGPHSGLVKISDGKNISIINTWDRYCYYPRNHFVLPITLNGDLRFNVLNDAFDTIGYEGTYDFTNEKKKLIIHGIYFIGQRIKILNIDDSSSINHFLILWQKLMSRLRQLKSKIQR